MTYGKPEDEYELTEGDYYAMSNEAIEDVFFAMMQERDDELTEAQAALATEYERRCDRAADLLLDAGLPYGLDAYESAAYALEWGTR